MVKILVQEADGAVVAYYQDDGFYALLGLKPDGVVHAGAAHGGAGCAKVLVAELR